MRRHTDITGQRFGKLTVVELSERYGTRGARKLEDAVAARKAAEKEYFGEFLEEHDSNSTVVQRTAEQEDSTKM